MHQAMAELEQIIIALHAHPLILRVVRINKTYQMEIAIADMTHQWGQKVRSREIALRLQDALRKPPKWARRRR